MKNISGHIYLLFFLVILTMSLLVINILKDKSNKNTEFEIKNKELQEKNIIEYKANETIRVKMSSTNEVVAMDVNDYLRGVVPSEMSPTYNEEALKAQALVARTYLYKKIIEKSEGDDAEICDNFAHCQAYTPKEKLIEIWRNKGYSDIEINTFWDKVNTAVVSTQGKIVTYNGECINAYFHASSPQKTENLDQIWGCTKSLPYLVSVENEEDETYPNRTSTVTLSLDELNSIICQRGYTHIDGNDLESSYIFDYTTSGRVKNILIGQNIISAELLRTIFGLKSTNFTMNCTKESITFNVIGYGHGVGMSQVGANTLAGKGKNYEEIIKYYYKGVEITTLN